MEGIEASTRSGSGAGSAVATILLVDDDACVLELARDILVMAGFAVLAATSGADALRLVEGDGPRVDLVLTDVAMPGMTGPEMVERLVTRRRVRRILYMSGHGPEALAALGLRRGGRSLIRKPFTLDGLLRAVRGALAAPPEDPAG